MSVRRILDLFGNVVFVSEGKVILQNSGVLLSVLEVLKKHSSTLFTYLVDIIIFESNDGYLIIVYVFVSVDKSSRVEVICPIGKEHPSIIEKFKSANWLEREAADMFGVFFSGHEDLRRLLTDYGFKGHPLLKTFVEENVVTFDEAKKILIFFEIGGNGIFWVEEGSSSVISGYSNSFAVFRVNPAASITSPTLTQTNYVCYVSTFCYMNIG